MMISVASRSQWRERMTVVYLAVLGVVAFLILAQSFLAGVYVFAQPAWLTFHMLLGRVIGLIILAAVICSLATYVPARIRWLNIAMLPLYAIQYNHRRIATAFGVPELAGIHVLNAFLIFGCITFLIVVVWRHLHRPA